MKEYIIEDLPSEWGGAEITALEAEFIDWVNDKLQENKQFCCFIPNSKFVIAKALFITND